MQSTLPSIVCVLLVTFSSVSCEQQVDGKFLAALKSTLKHTRKLANQANDAHSVAGDWAKSKVLRAGLGAVQMVRNGTNAVADDQFGSSTKGAVENIGRHVTDSAVKIYYAFKYPHSEEGSGLTSAASSLMKIPGELQKAKLGAIGDLTAGGAGLVSHTTKGVGQFADVVLTGVGLDRTGKIVSTGANYVGDITQQVGFATKGALDDIGDEVTDTVAKIGACVTGTNLSHNDTDKLTPAIKNGASCLLKIAAQLKKDKLSFIGDLASTGTGIISDVAKGSGQYTEAVLTDLGLKQVGVVMSGGAYGVAYVSDQVGSVTKRALDGTENILNVAADVIGDRLTGTNSTVTGILSNVTKGIGQFTDSVLTQVGINGTDGVGEMMTNGANAVAHVTEQVGSVTKDAFNHVGNILNVAADVGDSLTGTNSTVTGMLSNVTKGIGQFTDSVLTQVGINGTDGVGEAMINSANAVADVADQVGSVTKDAINSAGKTVTDIGQKVTETASSAVKSAGEMAGSIISGVDGAGKAVSSKANAMVNEGANAVADVADKVGSATKDAINSAGKTVTDVAGKITGWFG